MADEEKIPYHCNYIVSGINRVTYKQLRRFAHLVCSAAGSMDRDYDEVPEEEITKMAGALLLAAEDFSEAWE